MRKHKRNRRSKPEHAATAVDAANLVGSQKKRGRGAVASKSYLVKAGVHLSARGGNTNRDPEAESNVGGSEPPEISDDAAWCSTNEKDDLLSSYPL